tara:strand:+ start:17487 stop:17939 length:453 start_codon:yes stop_codon:yes gene_type:complete
MLSSKFQYAILVNSIRFLFIILFVYAATNKVIDFNHFKIQLGQSPYISTYANWMSWMIPTIEYLIVGLFLFQKSLLTAFRASFSLMTLFTTYIFFVLSFSDSLPCTCGGIISSLGWREHFIFNLIFIGLALIGIIMIHKQRHDQIKINTT